jgi:MscS family membrane protein
MPNGQINRTGSENAATRREFWFHYRLGLHYQTTAAQVRSVLEQLNSLLAHYPRVEDDSIRVRFLHLGASSAAFEILVYLFARNATHFGEMQKDLVVRISDVIQQVGIHVAFPSQRLQAVRPISANGNNRGN